MMNKPYAEACERNRQPIFTTIKPLLADTHSVLEIGSGTGQHAVYFAEQLPNLSWQTSDIKENLTGINLWLDEAGLPNTPPPLELDVSIIEWDQLEFDTVFSANAVHIMGWNEVEIFMTCAGNRLPPEGKLILYGPFNYKNQYTSESNRQFDVWLKDRDPASGIRNFEDLNILMDRVNMKLKGDFEMPANNRILYWQKV